MNLTPEICLQLVVAVGAGFGSYAAIRADLTRIYERATQAHDAAAHAHRRIDDHLSKHC